MTTTTDQDHPEARARLLVAHDADRAYFLARLIDRRAGRTTPFRSAADAALARTKLLLDASVALHPERGDERVRLRSALQDLLDVTELLLRRIEAAYDIGAGTEQVIARYAGEYERAVKAWQDAVDVVLGYEPVPA
jgi:hypothetical protein